MKNYCIVKMNTKHNNIYVKQKNKGGVSKVIQDKIKKRCIKYSIVE